MARGYVKRDIVAWLRSWWITLRQPRHVRRMLRGDVRPEDFVDVIDHEEFRWRYLAWKLTDEPGTFLRSSTTGTVTLRHDRIEARGRTGEVVESWEPRTAEGRAAVSAMWVDVSAALWGRYDRECP